MSFIDTRGHQLFPVLDAAQIATAKRFASGAARKFAPGETVYDVGTRNTPTWLVLKGTIDIGRRDGLNHEAPIATLGIGQFTGEVGQLSGRAHLGVRAGRSRRLHRVPFDAAHVRALVVGSADVGETLMRAFILRRVGLIQDGGAGSVLIGRPGAPELVRLQGFLSPQRLSQHRARRRQRRGRPRRGGAPRRAAGGTAADALPERHRAQAAH